MRLDHLLSKEEEVRVLYTVESLVSKERRKPEEKSNKKHSERQKISGADALRGDTRSHPEHDG